MSMEAIAAIIEKIDAGTPKGMRDRFFIMLMYDAGARIQEMVRIKLCDLETGKTPKVTLTDVLNGFSSVRYSKDISLCRRLSLSRHALIAA